MARKIISSDITPQNVFYNGTNSNLHVEEVKTNRIYLKRRINAGAALESYDLPAVDAIFCLSITRWEAGAVSSYPADPTYVANATVIPPNTGVVIQNPGGVGANEVPADNPVPGQLPSENLPNQNN